MTVLPTARLVLVVNCGVGAAESYPVGRPSWAVRQRHCVFRDGVGRLSYGQAPTFDVDIALLRLDGQTPAACEAEPGTPRSATFSVRQSIELQENARDEDTCTPRAVQLGAGVVRVRVRAPTYRCLTIPLPRPPKGRSQRRPRRGGGQQPSIRVEGASGLRSDGPKSRGV